MKNVWVLISFFFVGVGVANSQNLVGNGSFEDYTLCPDGGGQVERAVGWENWLLSPDYFHSCSPELCCSVPNNIGAGYQMAYDGDAYMGFFNYFSTEFQQPYARELIASLLESPLVVGQLYYVSFKVSLATNGGSSINGATNNIGAKFTTQSQSNTYNLESPLINNSAHIWETSIIEDSVNWTTISGSFVADSIYNYIVIGNFFDDAHTLRNVPDEDCLSYYYLEDVCVSTDFALCGLANSTNQIDDNIPNPISFFSCVYNNLQIVLDERTPLNNCEYILYHVSGLVLEKNAITHYNFSIDCSNFAAGAYFLKLNFENQSFTKPFFIN